MCTNKISSVSTQDTFSLDLVYTIWSQSFYSSSLSGMKLFVLLEYRYSMSGRLQRVFHYIGLPRPLLKAMLEYWSPIKGDQRGISPDSSLLERSVRFTLLLRYTSLSFGWPANSRSQVVVCFTSCVSILQSFSLPGYARKNWSQTCLWCPGVAPSLAWKQPGPEMSIIQRKQYRSRDLPWLPSIWHDHEVYSLAYVKPHGYLYAHMYKTIPSTPLASTIETLSIFNKYEPLTTKLFKTLISSNNGRPQPSYAAWYGPREFVVGTPNWLSRSWPPKSPASWIGKPAERLPIQPKSFHLWQPQHPNLRRMLWKTNIHGKWPLPMLWSSRLR